MEIRDKKNICHGRRAISIIAEIKNEFDWHNSQNTKVKWHCALTAGGTEKYKTSMECNNAKNWHLLIKRAM